MAEEENVELTWEQLGKLTEEVIAPTGPGSKEWEGSGSHTEKFNRAVIEDFRRNKGVVSGEIGAMPIVLLTTIGRKSGKPRTNPVAYFNVDDRLFVIASMGGAERNPPWYFNLLDNPRVTVEIGEEKYEAEAVVLEGEERTYFFDRICEQNDVFIGYQERTGRELPVIELRRLG